MFFLYKLITNRRTSILTTLFSTMMALSVVNIFANEPCVNKGFIQCRRKEGKLTFAGDVRARWIALDERCERNKDIGLEKCRGRKKKDPTSIFRSEVNLFFDYETSCTWLSTKLRWVACGGKECRTPTKIEIDRAFIGYDIYEHGKEDLYIELGRSNLSYMFESRIEFTSFFDGVHLYYTNCFPKLGTFVVHGGPFIVDSCTNHFAWIAEVSVRNWWRTGFLAKYSIVDWNNNRVTRHYGKDTSRKFIKNSPRYRFLVSQLILGYERKLNIFGCKWLYAYGAVLANHQAKASLTSDWKKLNRAWYAGFTLGRLCKAYDWTFDFNYQSVGMQSIPEFDLSGIGHGNVDNAIFCDSILSNCCPRLARGPLNYRGCQGIFQYLISDNLQFKGIAQYSVPHNKNVGGNFHFKSLELSLTYVF